MNSIQNIIENLLHVKQAEAPQNQRLKGLPKIVAVVGALSKEKIAPSLNTRKPVVEAVKLSMG
jgi:hypothetical protein